MKEQQEFFQTHGYLVVPAALSADEVQLINDVIDRDLVENSVNWFERENGHYQLSVHILLAQPEIDFTMHPPRLMPLLEAIMGPDLCAEEHSVRIRKPNPDGETYCHWHRDATRSSRGAKESPPYISIVFYLSDVDDTTHSFSVIPDSHRPDELPPVDAYDLSTADHIVGKAGTAILFDTELFHAGNVRRTTAERRTIHLYCGRTTDRYLSNYTVFPRRLWQGKDAAMQKYYSRPNQITKLLLDRF
jgi:hypothetical protein